WSPDGARIVFTSDRNGQRNLYLKNASGLGEEELLRQSSVEENAESWSLDGRWIAYNTLAGPNNRDVWTFSLDTREARPFQATRSLEHQASFSPNGKWIAYTSNETGRSEIWVRTFAGSNATSGGKWQISSDGGMEAQWRGDGKELFYTSLQFPPAIMALDIEEQDSGIIKGTPHRLFEVRLAGGGRNRWVAPADGQKFLAVVPVEPKPPTTLNVILNWPSLLKK